MVSQLINEAQTDSLLHEQQSTCERCRRPLDGQSAAAQQVSDLAAIDIYAVPLPSNS